MDDKDETLIGLLERRVQEASDRPLYSFLDRGLQTVSTLSYADVYRRAMDIASVLQHRRIGNAPVALLYSQCPDFIFAFFGVILAGARPVPLVRARGRDWSSLLSVISASGATTLLTVAAKGRLIPNGLLQRHNVAMICTDESALHVEGEWHRPSLRRNDTAFIQYTSGSTSRPKGVIVSHENVFHNSERIRCSLGLSPQDTLVSWLPFHHDMGLIGHVLQALYTGFHNYFLRPADFLANPLCWLGAISRYGGTVSGGPNFAYAMCATRLQFDQNEAIDLDLSCWRLAYCGSERIVPETLRRFAGHLRCSGFDSRALFACYGMAESTLFVCGQFGLSERQTTSESATHPAVGVIDEPGSVAIVDPQTSMPLQDGEAGEIWIKSASVSSGYHRDPQATRDTFGHAVNGSGGYMRTGDIGFVRDCALHFVGRFKNLIKRRGRSYYCEDIEVAVEASFRNKGVLRCAAFELENREDDDLNEAALVILCERDDRSATPHLPEMIAAMVCDVIGIIASDVVLLDRNSLPLTTSGKLQRSICRDLYVTNHMTTRPPTHAQAGLQDVENRKGHQQHADRKEYAS